MKRRYLLVALLGIASPLLRAQTPGFNLLEGLGCSKGSVPASSMLIGNDGRLFGTATEEGESAGTLFRMERDGTGFKVLHDFTDATGSSPIAGLLGAGNGKLYGSTTAGGANGVGVLFTTDGDGTNYSILRSLSVADGNQIFSRLIEGADGRIFGVAAAGGANGDGTIFRINPDGTGFVVLLNAQAAATGSSPRGALVQVIQPGGSQNGLLYGTMSEGGTGDGTIYSIGVDGQPVVVWHNFNEAINQGKRPVGGLLQGPDGRLYGTTELGGAHDKGVIFAIATDGTGYTVIHHFNLNPEGVNPLSGVTFGTDGRVYGTTSGGGSFDGGVIFRINSDGTGYQVLHHFQEDSGIIPLSGGLVRDAGGVFYGTTSAGIDDAVGGSVFAFNPAGSPQPPQPNQPVITAPLPTIAVEGSSNRESRSGSLRLRGSSSGAQSVFFQVNGGSAQLAQGTTNWTAIIRLKKGRNTVIVYSINAAGQQSGSERIRISRTSKSRRKDSRRPSSRNRRLVR